VRGVVFVSHASVDAAVAARVVGFLEAAGETCWVAPRDIQAGQNYAQAILDGLDAAKAIVLLCSAQANGSPHVQREMERAASAGKPIIPVKLDRFDPSGPLRYFVGASHWLDATVDAGRWEEELLAAVRTAVDVATRGQTTPSPTASSVAPSGPSPSRLRVPAPRTPTHGRQDEIAELTAFLSSGERLVTLTGLGGTGKTRLALEVAQRARDLYADGVGYVPMAADRELAEAWARVAQVLGLPDDAGGVDGITAWLGDRRLLLVLDNLEQLGDAGVLVDTLLDETAVSIIVTSRRTLHVPGEREFAVTPLSLPSGDDPSAMEASGAVQMFVDHAQRADRTFSLSQDNAHDVAHLCTRLEGIPLAIELAAARVKMLGPGALAAGLHELLDMGAPATIRDARHATIRKTLEWSYNLLDGPQQRAFDCLGVFAGEMSLPAVRAVTYEEDVGGRELPDLLFDLVDASLVQVHLDAVEPRFQLLEVLRAFARERLTQRGVSEARTRAHAQYFYDLTVKLLANVRGRDHRKHRDAFVNDLDNLKAVVETNAIGVRDLRYYVEPVPPSHVAAAIVTACNEFGRPREHTPCAYTR
jgi:predicted ATPase